MVIAAVSTTVPFLKTSLTLTRVPRIDFAYSNLVPRSFALIPDSMMSGTFLGTPVRLFGRV